MKIRPDRRVLLAAAGALFIVVLIILAVSSGGHAPTAAQKAEIENSISYLRALEATGAEGVHAAIRNAEIASRREELGETMRKIDSGEADIWSFFSDAVILGDSRADDFQYNSFLPKSRILADMGAMCTEAEKYLDVTMDLYPSQIYFTYGMNDVDGSWDTTEGFIEAYRRVIRLYMDDFPYAEIFVSSIIPVNQHAIDNDSNYLKIPEYNEAMKQMTSELGLTWIDCDHMLDEYPDYYDTDGQHFFPEAYPLWARLMLEARFNYESALAGEMEIDDGTDSWAE